MKKIKNPRIKRGDEIVLRGGSIGVHVYHLRSASRIETPPNQRDRSTSLRLMLKYNEKSKESH